MRVPEAGINGRDTELHDTVPVWCDYLSLHFIPVLAHKFSYVMHVYSWTS